MATTLQATQYSQPATSTPSAIEVSHLSASYGRKRALHDLSFTVPAGSICGFLGPNGAGKTTTIKTLLGFHHSDGGSAQVLGYDVARDSLEIRARVGFVSESNSLYDNLTIPQLCDFTRETSRRWDQATVDRHLVGFGLPMRGKVRGLSKGMKSQLALCLALGSDPDMLILDEPTTGLDPLARHTFLNIVVGEFAAAGRTIFFSSHILSEVEAVADRVCIVDEGRLLVSDDLDNLKQTQKVLKITYSDIPTQAEVESLQGLASVAHVEQEGRNIRVLARGDVEALCSQARLLPGVLNVAVVDLNLEDIFLEYMREARRDS